MLPPIALLQKGPTTYPSGFDSRLLLRIKKSTGGEKKAHQLASRCGTGPYRAGLVVIREPEQLQYRQEEIQHIQVHADRSHHIVGFLTAH